MGDVMGGTERDRGILPPTTNNNTGAGVGNTNIETSSRGGLLGGAIGGSTYGGLPGSANNGSPGPSGTSEISLLRGIGGGDNSNPPRIETQVPGATISGTSTIRNDVRLDMP